MHGLPLCRRTLQIIRSAIRISVNGGGAVAAVVHRWWIMAIVYRELVNVPRTAADSATLHSCVLWVIISRMGRAEPNSGVHCWSLQKISLKLCSAYLFWSTYPYFSNIQFLCTYKFDRKKVSFSWRLNYYRILRQKCKTWIVNYNEFALQKKEIKSR